MAKSIKTPLTVLGAAFLASSVAPLASADVNPFAATQLAGGYDLANYNQQEGKQQEGKCGEAKCGADKAAEKAAMKAEKEGKCGGEKVKTKEGKCGANKEAAEGK